MPNYIDQGALADKAFAEYEFGDGVMVTDTSGWEYTTPGHERVRKVYVETESEDDGPEPRWVLNFTVRFDPDTGSLSEAYAMDEKGQIWGSMPNQREVSNSTEVIVEYGVNELMSGGAGHNPFDTNFDTQEQAEAAGLNYLVENPEVKSVVIFELNIEDNTIIKDETILSIGRSDSMVQAAILARKAADERKLSNYIEQPATRLNRVQQGVLATLQSALTQATDCGLFDEMAAHSHPDRINAFCDDLNGFAGAEGLKASPGPRNFERMPNGGGDLGVAPRVQAAPDLAGLATPAELALIRAAVENYLDLVSSPTSADRSANGDDWADREVQACNALLQSKLQLIPSQSLEAAEGPQDFTVRFEVSITAASAEEAANLALDDLRDTSLGAWAADVVDPLGGVRQVSVEQAGPRESYPTPGM